MQVSSLKPFAGLRIIVTRPREQSNRLSEKLRGLGASTIELPTIEIVPVDDLAEMDQAIQSLEEYDWLIFTSIHGVRFFLERMANLKVPFRKLRELKVAAIGPATAAALENARKVPDYVPEEYLSEKILLGLGDVKGKRVLLPRADIASNKLPMLLDKAGALVDQIVAYRTIVPQTLTSERLADILSDGVDWVTFTSPSTVRNFAGLIADDKWVTFKENCKVACIGPVTAEAAKGLGLNVKVIATTHTIDALVEAMVNEVRIV